MVWSSCCPRDSQDSSPAPQFESINSLVLSILYGSTLSSIHDYWKNHILSNLKHSLIQQSTKRTYCGLGLFCMSRMYSNKQSSNLVFLNLCTSLLWDKSSPDYSKQFKMISLINIVTKFAKIVYERDENLLWFSYVRKWCFG